ncbi:apolipoprotein N-acyltransferase [Polymorphobacter glacialis]|uniref:Apolipoprotein N-acyltransferase n=2 Tax=Sandarakinorhabdus glacialis TaxID=1614636 RepID=A0A917E7V5_9SPHN|nr:apolipoprotein N-acyltransferase [Polymorphobacter glacialis]
MVAIGLTWLASTAAAMFWFWQVAIPVVPASIVGAFAYGTLFAVPFMLDRLFWRQLPQAGALLLFPAAVASCEFITGSFSPLGTSYGLLAVTQDSNLALLQVVSVAGPYLVGFLIGWFATVVNLVWQNGGAWRKTRRPVMVYGTLLAAITLGGALRLILFPPQANSVRIGGITPSMEVLAAANRVLGKDVLGASRPISEADHAKIDPSRFRPAYGLVWAELLGSTRAATRAGAKIITWSENAAVVRAEDESELLALASDVARQEQVYINVAVNVPFARDRTHLIAPSGKVLWTYDKSHPIPGMENYAPGPGRPAEARTPWGRIANVICYDADFPAMMHASADIMLIPAGDWPQIGRVHTLKMASLRAIENGYSIFRQDYNGVSAAIDHQGRVLAMQDTTGRGVHMLIADVPTRGVVTLYRATGDVFAWLSMSLTLALVALAAWRRRNKTMIAPPQH